ncbi:MAG: DUF6301 family protein [Arachnia propionica]|uniref:DUF6301 family protein n=1 Tax=Arachnia propionica TaxID=1750 RepID=UPI0027087366|nr:DUF6301 family protein [Arachnia propionica]
MNHLPFHTAHHWITQLTQLDPPLTSNQIATLAAELHWEPAKDLNDYVYHQAHNATLIQVAHEKKANEILSVTFALAKNRPPSLTGSLKLIALYEEYLEKAKNTWGKPTDFATNPTRVIWNIHKRAYIQLRLRPNQIMISLDRSDPNDPE